jgi:hypothetical protein
VFQERLLTSRILHFSHDQLFWECREHRACERYPDGHPSLFESDEDTNVYQFRSLIGHRERGHASPSMDTTHSGLLTKDVYYDMWMKVVEKYSSTILTNQLDRLIALSGIAKSMYVLIQDTYVAGMWRGSIEHDLRWYNRNRFPNDNFVNNRPSIYCAPSWSWASISDPISILPLESLMVLIQVVDVVVQHATDDITGQVTGGWLDLRGQLKPMTLSWIEYGGMDAFLDGWKITMDKLSPKPRKYCQVILDVPVPHTHHFENDNAEGRLFYMPFTGSIFHEYVAGESQFIEAFLLRVIDAQIGVFERIGMAHADGEVASENEVPGELLDELEEEVKKRLPCLEYRDGLHTIRII